MEKKAAKKYNSPEHSIVHGLIRNEPVETYEATDFHEALLFGIAREIGRVHWNRYQTLWDRWSDDPHIPGIQWRRYSYECGCSENSDGFIPKHEENCKEMQPNFGFEDVRFVWYKNPGRGMSINKDWAHLQWAEWFDRCLAKIREFDIVTIGFEGIPMPSADHCHSAQCKIGFTKTEEKRSAWIAALQKNMVAADRQFSHNWLTGKREARTEFRRFLTGDKARKKEIVEAVAYGIYAERIRAQYEDRPEASKKPE